MKLEGVEILHIAMPLVGAFRTSFGTEAVRETLLTSMRGVALTYGFDPRDPSTDPHVAQWKAIARALLGL